MKLGDKWPIGACKCWHIWKCFDHETLTFQAGVKCLSGVLELLLRKVGKFFVDPRLPK